MSSPGYLLDTSVIVALLVSRDQKHSQAIEIFKNLEPPFLTCEPVLSEACFLINRANHEKQSDKVLELGKIGFYKLGLKLSDHLMNIHHLLVKYRDIPISLADACLIRSAEIYDQPHILTFDSDFKIYKWGRNKKFNIIDK